MSGHATHPARRGSGTTPRTSANSWSATLQLQNTTTNMEDGRGRTYRATTAHKWTASDHHLLDKAIAIVVRDPHTHRNVIEGGRPRYLPLWEAVAKILRSSCLQVGPDAAQQRDKRARQPTGRAAPDTPQTTAAADSAATVAHSATTVAQTGRPAVSGPPAPKPPPPPPPPPERPPPAIYYTLSKGILAGVDARIVNAVLPDRPAASGRARKASSAAMAIVDLLQRGQKTVTLNGVSYLAELVSYRRTFAAGYFGGFRIGGRTVDVERPKYEIADGLRSLLRSSAAAVEAPPEKANACELLIVGPAGTGQ